MDSLRSRAVLKAMIAVDLVALIAIVVIMHSSSPACQPETVKPLKPNSELRENICSRDYRALASLAGYFKYKDEPSKQKSGLVYVPLGVRWVNVDDLPVGSLITLLSDCSKMSISLRENRTTKEYYSDDVQLTLLLDGGERSACHLRDPTFIYKAGKHYRCNKEQQFDCYIRNRNYSGHYVLDSIGTVVLYEIEFEIGVNAREERESGIFSTPSDSCD